MVQLSPGLKQEGHEALNHLSKHEKPLLFAYLDLDNSHGSAGSWFKTRGARGPGSLTQA